MHVAGIPFTPWVDVRHYYRLSASQAAHVACKQRFCAGKAVALEHAEQLFMRAAHGRAHHGPYLGRMVRVIVKHLYAAAFAHQLEPAPRKRILVKRAGRRVKRHAKRKRHGQRRNGVHHIMLPRHAKGNASDVFTVADQIKRRVAHAVKRYVRGHVVRVRNAVSDGPSLLMAV